MVYSDSEQYITQIQNNPSLPPGKMNAQRVTVRNRTGYETMLKFDTDSPQNSFSQNLDY